MGRFLATEGFGENSWLGNMKEASITKTYFFTDDKPPSTVNV